VTKCTVISITAGLSAGQTAGVAFVERLICQFSPESDDMLH